MFSQVEPEVQALSERCPLLVLPGTSRVERVGRTRTRRLDYDKDSQLALEVGAAQQRLLGRVDKLNCQT